MQSRDYKERRKQRRKRATRLLEDASDNDASNNEEEEEEPKYQANELAPIGDEKLIEPRRERRPVLGKIQTRKNVSDSVDQNEKDATTASSSDTAIIEAHRDKSRELAQRIGDENPNEVIEELHVVRDKIKDKIKQPDWRKQRQRLLRQLKLSKIMRAMSQLSLAQKNL